MSKLCLDLLDPKRKDFFSKLTNFKKIGFLGGGTAISLQLGHRRSYDFDILLDKPVKRSLLRKVTEVFSKSAIEPQIDTSDELTILLDKGIKLTFLYLPFKNLHPLVETGGVSLCGLDDLASSKAYAIGRRGTWRDYADVYFLITSGGLRLKSIIAEAKKRFGGNFSEKLFLEQLTYFGDIEDFAIDFVGREVAKERIMGFLEGEVRKILPGV